MIKTIMKILIRAMKVGLKYDTNIQKDLSILPNNYTIKLRVLPDNINYSFIYEGNKIAVLDEVEDDSCNLLVEFKDMVSAKKVFTGKMSLSKAFCEHRIKVYGSINNAMALTRVINTLECYLFSHTTCLKLFTPLPDLKISKLKFYLVLLLGGKL